MTTMLGTSALKELAYLGERAALIATWRGIAIGLEMSVQEINLTTLRQHLLLFSERSKSFIYADYKIQ